MEDGSACGSRTQRSCQSPHFLILSSVKTCCVSKASRLRFSRPTYRASMEPAILAIHDFAPTVVGPTEPDRAAAASAHDGTRSQDHPQLHQQAQNVLYYVPSRSRSTRCTVKRIAATAVAANTTGAIRHTGTIPACRACNRYYHD